MSGSKNPSAWGFSLSDLGAALGMIARGAITQVAAVFEAVGTAAIAISQALLDWARRGYSDPKFSAEIIRSDRAQEGLDPNIYYVAVCGSSGSGKSSLLNALRGLRNNHPDAASVGTTETTLERQEYPGAACFDRLCLVDFPGAGTQRVPAKGYFKANNLHCYDCILIICGERFGEIEIALVQACIVQQKRFAIVRSRSDETILRVIDDNDVSSKEAKKIYMENEVAAIAEELERSLLPRESILKLLRFFVLVNKNTLRRLTTLLPHDWPRAISEDEIHERKLLQFLGKAGVTDEHLGPGAEEQRVVA